MIPQGVIDAVKKFREENKTPPPSATLTTKARGQSNPTLDAMKDAGMRALQGVSTTLDAIPPSVDLYPGPVDNVAVMGLAGLNKGIKTLVKGERGMDEVVDAVKAVQAIKPFEGFADLTTKTLEKLKGRTTTSKQFISDLTNAPDLKQPERDVIRKVLGGLDDTVDVPKFASKVKDELLPLKAKSSDLVQAGTKDPYANFVEEGSFTPKWESVNLPDDLRGPVTNYKENIYESPIETSAGSAHYNYHTKNYFAHTRVEDLADNGIRHVSPTTGKVMFIKQSSAGGQDIKNTRRVIELQSDLFQKGNLEREQLQKANLSVQDIKSFGNKAEIADWDNLSKKNMENGLSQAEKNRWGKLEQTLFDRASQIRNKKLTPLESYRNTWHERVIREEVKKAAQDGKTKLQFPTGDTAMKIEGLAQGDANFLHYEDSTYLKPSDLVTGQKFNDQRYRGQGSGNFVVVEKTGDNTFKAVRLDEDTPQILFEYKDSVDANEYDKALQQYVKKKKGLIESFSLSDGIDKENPIYKFYEKEVGRYLNSKYKAQRIKDAQGVEWYQIDVKPEQGKLPIEAFGVLPAIPLIQQKERDKKKSLTK